MISFYTPNIYDPWTNSDLVNYDRTGSQRDEIIYNSFHNAKIRLFEKNLFISSFKTKSGDYKNIYVAPVTASTFLFLAYFPQIDYATQLRTCNGVSRLLDKLPLLGTISQKLSRSKEYKINNDLTITKEGVILIVHASVGHFLFPKHKKIEDSEILEKYGIVNGLYAQISKEYDALGSAIKKYNSIIDEREAKYKYLLAKQVIKTGIKLGLYASGIGAGVAAFMDIDDIWTAGETISNISDLADFADITDVTDLADGLESASDLSDYSDLSYLTGVDNFDIPSEFEGSSLNLPDDGYNVSFGAQKETLTSQGGGQHLDVTIEKEPGTANQFCIKSSKGTVHNVAGSDMWVKINGINYKLPRIKG